jgi:hypothetical protein
MGVSNEIVKRCRFVGAAYGEATLTRIVNPWASSEAFFDQTNSKRYAEMSYLYRRVLSGQLYLRYSKA